MGRIVGVCPKCWPITLRRPNRQHVFCCGFRSYGVNRPDKSITTRPPTVTCGEHGQYFWMFPQPFVDLSALGRVGVRHRSKARRMDVGGLRRVTCLEQSAVVERINGSVRSDNGPHPQVGFIGGTLELSRRERAISCQQTGGVRSMAEVILRQATDQRLDCAHSSEKISHHRRRISSVESAVCRRDELPPSRQTVRVPHLARANDTRSHVVQEARAHERLQPPHVVALHQARHN